MPSKRRFAPITAWIMKKRRLTTRRPTRISSNKRNCYNRNGVREHRALFSSGRKAKGGRAEIVKNSHFF